MIDLRNPSIHSINDYSCSLCSCSLHITYNNGNIGKIGIVGNVGKIGIVGLEECEHIHSINDYSQVLGRGWLRLP